MRTANSAAQRRKNGFLCNSITIGEPHDQGLVFKWGSLVGVSLPSEGIDWTSSFVVGSVEFTPAGFIGHITNDWTSVPCCETTWGFNGDTDTDHLAQVHNPTNGIGDICRQMGVIDSANWRIPTATELDALYTEQKAEGEARRYGAWAVGSFEPLSGLIMGPQQNNVTISSNTVTNADPYDDGAVFLPASGYRHLADGQILNIGSAGFYWSSTSYSNDSGYYVDFNSSTIRTQASNPRILAFTIRCIRE